MRGDLIEFLARFVTPRRLARLERVLDERTRHVAVVLEDLHQPHNASACLRTCDGFGVQDVHVIERSREFSVSRKISLGAAQWLTMANYQGEDGTVRCFDALRREGYRVVAVSPSAGEPVHDYDVRRKTALVFGNERDGLSEAALAGADGLVAIPMHGFSQSFNISVAVAICLSGLVPRLRGLEIDWRLSEAERRTVRARWIRAALGSRAEPLEREFRKHRTGPDSEPG
jgi:tRNA (guanosine-2'-O-)-methyltransferase